jgi:hypothetical protein
MQENEIKAQIKLLTHLLNGLCECEITPKGRLFLEVLRDKLKKRINDTTEPKK